MAAKDLKKIFVDSIFILLKEKGFKKVGMNFSLKQNDLIYFIQIQSSQTSTSLVCKLTLNIGIVSQKICELDEIDKPSYLDSHWKQRIGHYLSQPTDKWWEIKDSFSTNQAIDEISGLLINKALPNIFLFKTTKDLEDFWLSGNYQGLTKGQQENYLKLLGH